MPLSEIGSVEQSVVAAQADDLRAAGGMQRLLEPRRGGARRRPIRSSSSLVAHGHAQRGAAQPERAR